MGERSLEMREHNNLARQVRIIIKMIKMWSKRHKEDCHKNQNKIKPKRKARKVNQAGNYGENVINLLLNL